MKKIILILLFSFLILTVIAGSSPLIVSPAVAGNETHKHSDGETCSECESHSEKTEDHKHSEDASSEEHEHGEEHQHKEGDTCGVSQYHDRFTLDLVLEQPWRHPEKLRKDMWLMRIAPLSFLFLLSIVLRPAINKFMKKVGK
jgi:hypothetical protein